MRRAWTGGIRAALAIGIAASAAAGCASKRTGAAEEQEPLPALPTALIVENRRATDYTVFVDRGGPRVRLGMVPGPGTARFVVPADLIGTSAPLRVSAAPRAGSNTLDGSLVVRRGDTLIFYINDNDAQLVLTPSQ
jgi:hypothetical protein